MIAFFIALISAFTFSDTSYKCDTRYDKMGIPHVTTDSKDGFYYCFGLQHGRDRAWEMDFFKRTGQGRNAEVMGHTHIRYDLMMRLLNLPPLAEKIWKEIPANKKHFLEIYAQGANEGFKQGKEAKEFKDAGFEPEEWRPADSILVLLLQSFDQTKKTFFKDYEEQLARNHWGAEKAELFDEDDAPWLNTILKEGEYPKATKREVKTTSFSPKVKLWSQFPTVFGEESGSNNWVVSAKKSSTGNAILANDPHLDLKTPIIWYWLHMKSPEADVIGGSLPGVPVIAAGTNGKVAWGLTNAYINTADAIFIKDAGSFIERFRPTVWFKFGPLKIPFFFKSFERTVTGRPLLPLEIESDYKMVLRWTGYDLTATDILSMFDIFMAQDVGEMNNSLRQVEVPAWNFVFADTKGDIGFRTVGKAYRILEKQPFGLPVMSAEEFKQETFLGLDERPHLLKPKREYIYTANNRHWPADAAFYGGRGYSYSYRGFRIDELLNAKSKHDVESFKKIQCDRQAVDARFFVPKIMKHLEIVELKNWDLIVTDENKTVPVYRRLMDLMMEKWKVNEFALYKLLDRLSSEQVKEMKALHTLALKEVNGRSWGEIHRLGFEHMSKNPDWKFSPEIAGPGDNHTVDPGVAKWNAERNIYDVNAGASMRMIIEMKKRPSIQLRLPGINYKYTEKPSNDPWMEWKSCSYEEVEF